MGRLVAPNVFTEWTRHYWAASPRQSTDGEAYSVRWGSSSSPPVIAPFDMLAYGYGSCSAWSTILTCVGLP